MFKWIIFVVLLISGAILGFLYLQVKELEKNPSALPVATTEYTITIAHAYRDGTHRYAGYLYLPNSCHSVTATILRDPKLVENFDLRLTTRDLQLETAFCSQISSRYYFTATEEGPERVNLKFSINGKERPFKLEEGSWQADGATLQIKK